MNLSKIVNLHYITVATCIFFLVFMFHLVRIVAGFDLAVGGASIPMGVSWLGLLISGALVLYGKVLWLKEFKNTLNL